MVSGRYRITSVIAEGGMSVVFEALDRHSGQSVALKVLTKSAVRDPSALDELQHEAHVVAAVGHPNICAAYELGTTGDGFPYLVMERLAGQTLAERLTSVGPLEFHELAALYRDVLPALQAAHDRGVVHQDLKPHHLFLERASGTRSQRCRLLDFGIAAWISTAGATRGGAVPATMGWIAGTPYYMAPERARGDGLLDQRADLWSMAIIAYEALAGRRPFVASNYHALMVQILTSHPRSLARLRSDLSASMVAVVERGLAKAPEDRYQSAAEMLAAMEEADPYHRRDRIGSAATTTTARQPLAVAASAVDAAEEETVVLRREPQRRPSPAVAKAMVPQRSDEDTMTTLVIRRSDRR